MVRKSDRKRSPPDRLDSSSPVRPIVKGRARRDNARSDPISSFLASLYSEIDAYQRAGMSPAVRRAIRCQVRRARLRHALDTSPQQHRATYIDAINSYTATTKAGRGIASLVKNDSRPANHRQMTRLAEFAGSLGFPLLSICLHSAAFRTAINKKDDERLTWADRLTAITARASSLELFGTTRGLNIMTLLTDDEAHYAFIAAHVLHAELQRDRPNRSPTERLGYHGPIALLQRQQIGTNSRIPDLWKLSANETSVVRCRLRYTVTPEHAKDDYQLTTGQSRHDFMEDMQSSTRLSHSYTWAHRSDWPDTDPRYVGVNADACEMCGLSVECLPIVGADTGYSPAACGCKFRDYQAAKLAIRPIIELFTTPRTGTGVRALQDIEEGDILGEYIAQMYPDRRTDEHRNRYGGTEGGSDSLSLKLKCRRLKTGTTTPIGLTGVRSYVVDSALRGNWTRFINHSCNNNTIFTRKNIGQRELTLIEASKPIKFGEQITVDYGRAYFVGHGFGCRCGSLKCKWWDENNLRNGNMTLKVAVETHQRPQWAVDDAEVQAAIQAKNAT